MTRPVAAESVWKDDETCEWCEGPCAWRVLEGNGGICHRCTVILRDIIAGLGRRS